MAEVVAAGLLRFVSDQLASKALSEFALLTGTDKELKKLGRTLSAIQDVLEDAEAMQVKERALGSWLRKLKDLAYDADDVLDDFAIKSAKLKAGTEADMKEKLLSFLGLPKSIAFRRKIALRVKEINERLDEIAEERSKFHLKEAGALGRSLKTGSGPAREETGSFINESEVYGRKEDREKIVELLKTTTSVHAQDISVISIVGLGGLGKTTLAQLVYNDERVCEHFENRMWVCVSEDFELRRLVGLILESVTRGEVCPTNMDTMQVSLARHLKEKRFLLVLDDVWSESHEKWDRLRVLLAAGAKESKVLVTTRSERVASIMGAAPPHRLSALSSDDCWLLFKKRAFGGGADERNPNLVEIGREIANKCGGVPLAAKALGSLLRFKRAESGWLAVKNSELWKLSGDENYEILPALKLSYDHLSSSLKQCFAYCSIFPKDHKIDTGMLVRLWEAEGFLRPSNSGHLGLQYVDELLERSLFQKSMDGGGAETREVMMHDLVHDLARSVAGDECSIVRVGDSETYLTQNLRYASFICNNKEPLSAALQSLHGAKKLRTFYLHAPNKEIREEEDRRVDEVLRVISSGIVLLRALHLRRYPVKALPDSFKKLKHLRYLDLSSTALDSFPASISALQNLQMLNLSNSNIKSIPDSVGKLRNLSALDLSRCTYLSSLPGSIGQLKSLQKLDLSRSQIKSLPESICALSNLHTLGLRDCFFMHQLPQNMSDMKSLVHLNIHGCVELTRMPKRIGKLDQLRTMPIFIPGADCSLAELGSLRLEGELQIKNLLNVRRVEEAKGARLNEKVRIQSLMLSWMMPNSHHNPNEEEEEDEDDFGRVSVQHVEDVLQSLQPSKSLRGLRIEGYVGRTLPFWITELSLSNLVHLSLAFCYCEKLPRLGQLPLLEDLQLAALPLITQLGSDFYGGSNAFPSLKELELKDMTGLEEWFRVVREEPFLPCLESLTLQDCPKLKELPSDFPSVTALKMNVDDELLLSSLQSGAFPNLKKMNMQNYEGEGPLPQVLAERAETLTSWSLGSKPKPVDGDSRSSSSFGFGMAELVFGPGQNTVELPLF